MSKTTPKKKTPQRLTATRKSLSERISEKKLSIILQSALVLIIAAFFTPVFFGGKMFQSGDILSQLSYRSLYNEAGPILWDPYIFCGMPVFGNPGWYDILMKIFILVRDTAIGIFSSPHAAYTIYLMILSVGVFQLTKHLTKNSLVSFIAGIAAAFSSGLITLIYIGHVNKISTLCLFPFIFLYLLKLDEKFSLRYMLYLIIAVYFLFSQWHIQIIYYVYFSLGLFFLYFIIFRLIKKESESVKKLLITFVVFAFIATPIALSMNYYRIMRMYEYNPFSTRGEKSVVDIARQNTAQAGSDLYQYNTSWSFSPEEVLTFFVPSYYGYGASTYNGPLTNNQDADVNTYFGQMPLVDTAQYMGAAVLLLAILSIIINRKDRFVQFLSVLSGIVLLISFGKNFSLVFDIMYYYAPFFSTFRVPSMILNILQVTVPILAALGLKKIIDSPDTLRQPIVKYAALAGSGLFVLFLILKGSLTDWFISRVSAHAAALGPKSGLAQQFTALSGYMADMFTGDLLISIALMTLTLWIIYLMLSKKLGVDAGLLVIAALIIFDLARIDVRPARYIDKDILEGQFVKPDYITAIESQNDKEPYRILNLKQDGSLGSFNQNVNFHVYFQEEDFYGYSGLKPRSYQDLMDVVGPVNPTMWNMLNVKYIIIDKPTRELGLEPIFAGQTSAAHINKSYLPRAFFVETVQKATDMEVLQALRQNSFNPRKTAYAEEDLKVDKADTTAKAMITKYERESLEIKTETSGDNLLFIGNTFVAGNNKVLSSVGINSSVGWKAMIDGKETKIYKINSGFMGVIVPKGVHTVILTYAPDTFYFGRNITLIISILIILGIIYTIFQNYKTRKNVKQ